MRKRTQYWSAKVTHESRALALEEGVFTFDDPKRMARSLARSARTSSLRKGSAFQSAMSMLNFYVNRAGTNLSKPRMQTLQQAKVELRRIFKR